MTTAQQNASPGVYVSDDIGLEVTDGTQSRAQLGLLPVGVNNYGLRVVSADGTTVIIDGTSDVFKIAATGTVAINVTAAMLDTVVDTALAGLGTFSITPGLLISTTTDTTAQTANRYPGQTRLMASPAFVATTSGGAVTTPVTAANFSINGSIHLSGASSGTVSVQIWAANASAAAFPNAGLRYWVLVEAAL